MEMTSLSRKKLWSHSYYKHFFFCDLEIETWNNGRNIKFRKKNHRNSNFISEIKSEFFLRKFRENSQKGEFWQYFIHFCCLPQNTKALPFPRIFFSFF